MKQVLLNAFRATAILCLIGCSTPSTSFPPKWKVTVEKGDVLAKVFGNERGDIFMVPHGQVDEIPPCRASVVLELPCAVVLRTTTGDLFNIGAPDVTAEVGAFISSLRQGETYTFPEAFAQFQKRKGQSPNESRAGDGR